MTANSHCIQCFGANATGNIFRVRRIFKAPRTSHHPYPKTFVRLITFVLHFPHQNRIRYRLIHKIGIMKSIRRCRTHAYRHLYRKRSLENRVFCPPMVGIGIQAQTIPIAFQADAAPDGIPHLGNRDHRTVKTFRQIDRTVVSDYFTGSVLFLPSGFDGFWPAIHHGHIVCPGHFRRPILRRNDFHSLEILSEHLPECRCPIGNAFAQSRTVANCFVQNLYIRRTADIQDFQRLFFYFIRCTTHLHTAYQQQYAQTK